MASQMDAAENRSGRIIISAPLMTSPLATETIKEISGRKIA